MELRLDQPIITYSGVQKSDSFSGTTGADGILLKVAWKSMELAWNFVVTQVYEPCYILLDISVVNSHATSAYECELLAVTWHYSQSVRLDNARSVIRPRKRRLRRIACKHSRCAFVTRFKLIAAFVLATAKQ